MYELAFSSDAARSLRRIQGDPALERELRLRPTLTQLERDPFDPKLRTRQFRTDVLGHIRATPLASGEWYVLWQVRDVPMRVEIVEIVEVPL